MTKGAAEVRALATGTKLDINGLDGRVEFGRHISRIVKTDPILFGNLYHELDALLPIVSSKKIDYSLLITRPVKPAYPEPPTLESLSLEPSSSTSPAGNALLASALQRYNNDTLPDYTEEKKRYQRRLQQIEDQDANLFALTPASIDRLTRDYLKEYSDASAPHPSGVALFKLLLISHKPSEQSAMLARQEMWSDLTLFKQSRTMAMESYINGFMLLHQKLIDVDYKVDEAALVSVFVANMHADRFGSIFRILRMASPIADIETAYKVANQAAEQYKLQKPDLSRVTSHSAHLADDKSSDTSPARGRGRDRNPKKPAGAKKSSSPGVTKRPFTPPRNAAHSSTAPRPPSESKTVHFPPNVKAFDPTSNCGYCWRTLKRLCTHLEADCRKKTSSFTGMAVGSSTGGASHCTTSTLRGAHDARASPARSFAGIAIGSSHHSAFLARTPSGRHHILQEHPIHSLSPPPSAPRIRSPPSSRSPSPTGPASPRPRAGAQPRQSRSFRNRTQHRHRRASSRTGVRVNFPRCYPSSIGPSLKQLAPRGTSTILTVRPRRQTPSATRVNTSNFDRRLDYDVVAHVPLENISHSRRYGSLPTRLHMHSSPQQHGQLSIRCLDQLSPPIASRFHHISPHNPPYLQSQEYGRGVPAQRFAHHVVYTVTTAMISFTTELQCPRIILDSGATVSIVNDLALLHGVHKIFPVHVNGVGGTSTSTRAGQLGLFGPALYLSDCPHNILSQAVLLDHCGWVQCEPDPDNFPFERMRVTPFHYKDLLFARHEGLYFSEFPASWCNTNGDLVMESAPPRTSTSAQLAFPAVAVHGSDISVNFTVPELDRALIAGRLHRALHHPCDQYLSTILDHGVMRDTGVTSKDLRNHRVIHGPCKGCLLGKSRQPSSTLPSSTSAPVGEMLVMDIFFFYGHAGKKEPYLLSVESRTGHLLVSRMANKTAATLLAVIHRFLNYYKGHGHAVKTIRTDRETALLACESDLLALGVAMQRTGTASHAKQAERAIQTVKSRCRATKSSLGFNLPHSLHQYLVMDVVGALNDCVNSNCTPSTPNILIAGSRPSFNNHYGCPFGSVGIAKTPPNRERDDQPRAALAMCVGRDRSSQRALKVLVLSTQRVIHVNSFKPLDLTRDVIERMDDIASRDVDIGEDLLDGGDDVHAIDSSEPTLIDLADHQGFDDEFLDEHLVPDVADDSLFLPAAQLAPPPAIELPPAHQRQEPIEPADNVLDAPPPAPLHRPPVARKPRVPRAALPTDRVTRSMSARNALPAADPSAFNMTISEAAIEHGPEVVKTAIMDELRSLIEDTRAVVPCFTSEKQLPMHLLLKHKYNAGQVFEKCKARLVIGGNLQHRDEDIDTSSFCVRVQSILLLLGLAHLDKLKVHAVDIKTAYLHADVKSRVFGRMPKKVIPYLLELYPDMKKFLNKDGSMSFKVEKAVYGLAEASRLWFLHLTSLLSKLGYVASTNDKGVLYRMTPDGPVYILLHVDDMLVLSCHDKYWNELKDYFKANLRGITAQEGPVISFVALLIHQHANHISVDRRGYIDKLHSKRDPADIPRAKVSYPLTLNCIQPTATAPISLPPHSLSSEIMELRYLDDVRPDIKFATSHLTMNMSSPTVSLAKDSKQLLSYLHGTQNLSIRICPTTDQIRAYVDASYAIHPGSRSHYGVALCLGEQGYCFHAKSSAIKVVCRSSTEAELHAANEACSDVLHAVDLLTELGHPQGPVPFYEDNQAVIQLMHKSDFNFQTKSKHVRVRYDFLKEQVREGKIVFIYLPTELQLADILTKPLIGDKFVYFRDSLLGLVPHKPYPAAVG